MAKRCSTKTGCSYPRANWWKQSIGVDWFNQGSSGGDTPVVLDEDYQELLDYATSQGLTLPDVEYQIIGSEIMAELVSSGILAKKPAVYVLFANAEAREFCKLNWANPGTYTLTESDLDSLGFSSAGFDGDGVNVLLTGFNPSSAADANFTQNNASVTCFIVTDEASTGLDWGAFDGTRQSKLNTKNGSNQRAIHFNDGTNSTIADTYGKGWNVIFRNTAATKRSWKDGTQTDISVNSTGLPNEQFAIMGRRNQGANDFPTVRTIGYWSAGQAPSAAEIAAERRIIANGYIKAQLPLFTITDIEGAPTQLVSLGAGGTWDELALICGPVYHNGSILLYGGSNENNPGDVNQYSIGAFDLTNAYTGTKDAANPIVARASVGLGDALEGLVPHDIYDDGTYYYLGCTVYNSDSTLEIALMRALKSDPKNFGDYTIILSEGFATHAPRFFEDPDDPTFLYMTYSHKPTSGDTFRIYTAKCLKSNLLTAWTLVDSDVIASTPGSTVVSQEYAHIWKDGATWYCIYGRFYGLYGAANFSMWSTSSADRSSFPEGKENLPPAGVPSQFDENYRAHYTFETHPIPTTNVPLYFGGRQGLSGANYIGIGVKNIKKRA